MLKNWRKKKKGNKHIKRALRDTMVNMLTGMGTTKDKRMRTYVQVNILQAGAFECLYDDSAMAKKVVDIYPKNATREWIEIEGLEQQQKEKLEKELKRIKLKNKFYKAGRYSRLYGAGAILISDGTSLNNLVLPLKLTNKTKIQALVVFGNHELEPSNEKITDINETNFGMPAFYTLTSNRSENQDLNSVNIHSSRFIIIQGEETSESTFELNGYFNLSVLQRLNQILIDYTSSYDVLPNLISDFRVFVFKMKDLVQTMTESEEINGTCKSGEEEIKDRAEALRMARSILSMFMVDAEDSIEQITPNISGLKELYDKIDARLIAESDIPHTILMGESPNGSNATGNSTTIDWYSKVKDWQTRNYQDGLDRIFEILSKSLNVPEISYSFKPLFKPTEKEIIETRKIQADIDNIYIASGVYTPDEVRQSRFAGDKYSSETKVEGEIENEFEEEGDDTENGNE